MIQEIGWINGQKVNLLTPENDADREELRKRWEAMDGTVMFDNAVNTKKLAQGTR